MHELCYINKVYHHYWVGRLGIFLNVVPLPAWNTTLHKCFFLHSLTHTCCYALADLIILFLVAEKWFCYLMQNQRECRQRGWGSVRCSQKWRKDYPPHLEASSFFPLKVFFFVIHTEAPRRKAVTHSTIVEPPQGKFVMLDYINKIDLTWLVHVWKSKRATTAIHSLCRRKKTLYIA